MNKGFTTFQAVVLGVFVVFLIGGVAALALFKGGGAAKLPTVVIWGTLPTQPMNEIAQTDAVKGAGVTYQYVQKNVATFESDFVEALASGNSPDLVIFPHDLLFKQKNKLLLVPFSVYSERTFKDTFAQGGEVFLGQGGFYGFPYYIDPLVMYFNRSMLSSKGVARPPQFWDEFLTLAPKFNEKTDAGSIKRTIVALGETVNVANFKDVLSALMLQAGTPITSIDVDKKLTSFLSFRTSGGDSPVEASLRFYTEFSNPAKSTFSWNKSLLNSRDAFVAENLATYFGYAGELQGLRARNPNLNFDVAPLPQIRNGGSRLTFGHMYALVIPKNAKNAQAALTVAQVLTGEAAMTEYAKQFVMPPARRSLLASPISDPYVSVFYNGAIMARAWVDPSRDETSSVFAEMIDAIISGKDRLGDAIDRADREFQAIIKKYD